MLHQQFANRFYFPSCFLLRCRGGRGGHQTVTLIASRHRTVPCLLEPSPVFFSGTLSYTDDGAYKTSSTDQRDLQTTYDYDTVSGLLESTTTPIGPMNQQQTLTTTNTYNSVTRKLIQISNDFLDTKYTYEKNRLSSLQVGTDSVYLKFSLEYDDMGNCTTISRSSSGNSTPVVLATYTYLDGRNLVGSQTYANGQTLNYTYDDQDRLIGVSDGSNQISKYVYDSNGLLGKSYSYGGNSFTTTNQYDLANRLISTFNSNGSGIYNVGYDKNNLTTGYTSYLQDGSTNLEYTTEYKYVEKDDDGNVASGVNQPKDDILKIDESILMQTHYDYDAYGRLSSTDTLIPDSWELPVTVGYGYLDVGSDKTTTLPSYMEVNYTGGANPDKKYNLTYDRAGNITDIQTVLKNGTSSTNRYYYDSLSRLTAASNVGNTGLNHYYTYDGRNNITSSCVRMGQVFAESKSYTYATDDIDRLTSFSHTKRGIGTLTRDYTYDAVGNPTAIAETDSSDNSTRNLALTWVQGRRLSNVSDGSTLNNTYCYNANGNISQKTLADGSYMLYHYNGGELEYEEHFNASNVLQEVLKYSYDTDGNVEYLLYKDDNFSTASSYNLYYYVRNATGDITDLFQVKKKDANGVSSSPINRLAAHYEYDPYGNILSIDKYNNDNIGDINPMRYKDYYYDAETDWYQTGGRFYDPEVGRFLNADEYVATGQDLSGNMYAYCGNNPVNRCDPSGTFWKEIGNFIIGLGKGIKTAVVNFGKKVFGATSSVSHAVNSPTIKGVSHFITYTTGGISKQKVASCGNPSALISWDFTQSTDHPIKSNSATLKLTISKYSIGWSRGFNNIGISVSVTHGDTASSYAVKYSLLDQTSSYVTTSESIRGDTTTINYAEASYHNWWLVGAVVAIAGKGLSAGYTQNMIRGYE